jgi:SagB-type dehydrogenase family enzyme
VTQPSASSDAPTPGVSPQIPLPFKDYKGRPQLALPAPLPIPDMPLRAALDARRSGYSYGREALPLDTLSSLLHQSAGVSRRAPAYGHEAYPLRFAPSAGGLQPVNVYVAASALTGTEPGLYYYHPLSHDLREIQGGDPRPWLTTCCMQREFADRPGVLLILTCSMDRVRWKYSERHVRTVHIDVGIMAQNLYLAGTALGLSTCAISGFHEAPLHEGLAIDGDNEFAALLFAIGPPESRPRP